LLRGDEAFLRRELTVFIVFAGAVLGIAWFCKANQYSGNRVTDTNSTLQIDIGSAGDVDLTIVYDNNFYNPELEAAWGFACYLNTNNARILFDTGGDSEKLLYNMEKLRIPVEDIQVIILSHIHGDHTGGLFAVLERNHHVEVYVPASFPEDFKSKTKRFGCRLVEVEGSMKICEGVITTGELGSGIKEQSLVVNSSRGLIVVTGCAHPGIANIIEKAVELTDTKVYLVIGGFHLSGSSKKEIAAVVERFKYLNVTKVAPCHCSGDLARYIFKKSFGTNYIDAGVGRNLMIKAHRVDC